MGCKIYILNIMIMTVDDLVTDIPRASTDIFCMYVYNPFYINPLTSKERKKCMFVGCLTQRQQKRCNVFYIFIQYYDC